MLFTDLSISRLELKNLCLIEVEKLLNSNGRSLKEFQSMPFPSDSPLSQFQNHFLAEELNYDKEQLSVDLKKYLSSMNEDQRIIYDNIIDTVTTEKGGFYFVYGYGGTGKTFIWRTLSAAIRSSGKIVLNVASSGIASLLLPGGRTAHSRFSIPLTLTELSTCTIKQGSPKAEVLKQASLIIWDEACMINKFAFEALDRTLRDIMRFSTSNSRDKPFGGKTIVLGGDFRQILPVIPRASREDIVNATINSSNLWPHCKVLKLTKNMRLQATSSLSVEQELKLFAEWIIKIGDGKLGMDNDGTAEVEIPTEFLILESTSPLKSIVDFTYPNLLDNLKNYAFFEDRALLAPTLEVVEMVNEFVLSQIPGEEKEYLSSDSYCLADENVGIEANWITAEFLNEIKCSGIPNHKLVLKKGVPIMLLRNIDQSSGLCNGTRLIVEELGNNVIGAIVVTGNKLGEKVYIPRMNLIPSDPGMPLKFQRRQFPITLCFAMTINKSQGQSLSFVGLFLPKPVFTHGQLYVAISRVKSRSGLKLLILDSDANPCNITQNVVYPEVFQKI